jgi:hypothetical protein
MILRDTLLSRWSGDRGDARLALDGIDIAGLAAAGVRAPGATRAGQYLNDVSFQRSLLYSARVIKRLIPTAARGGWRL